MPGEGGGFLGPLVSVLLATLAVAALLRRLGLSTIAGYLVAGSILGPNGLAWLDDPAELSGFADAGIAFLLFTIGLELSVPRLLAGRQLVFGLGALQVAVTTGLFASIGWASGLGLGGALLVGGAVAMSSTAMGLKELSDQGEIDAPHGRAALGILLFQDLATVGFLALIAALQAGQGAGFSLQVLLREGAWRVGLLALVVITGRFLARPALRSVALARSPELLALAALTLALTAGWSARLAGLSPALGAFLAGTMLAETEFRHQLEADIRPFRDVLLGLFFLTTGALIDPSELGQAGEILVLLGLIVVGKLGVIVLLAPRFGLAAAAALRCGLALAHVGEFGLLLLGTGMRQDLLPAAVGQALLATATVGFIVGSVLLRKNASISEWLLAATSLRAPAGPAGPVLEVTGVHDHVILCGYGRVGQSVAHVLDRESIPWIALDIDPRLVADAHRGGQPVYLASAERAEVLRAAGVENARGVVIAIDDPRATERATEAVRRLRHDLPIVVRLRDEEQLDGMLRAGATLALPVALEASLGLAAEILVAIGRSAVDVARLAQQIRAERYASLRTYYPGTPDLEPDEYD